MKELSIEEKAKAYDEAIERAKKWHNAPNIDKIPTYGNRVIEEIFPELRESEDERIKKELIQFIKNWKDYNNIGRPHDFPTLTRNVEQCDRYIAWLEKQKDCIIFPNSAYTSNGDVIEFADKYSHTIWEKLMDKFKKNENYSIGCNDVSDIVLNAIINTYNWLEKQGEPKPFDYEHTNIQQKDFASTKPKFKVGDWLIQNERRNIVKVVSHTQLDYEVVNTLGQRHKITSTAVENNYHLWTIQDAKDGDVLAFDDNTIVIFKDLYNANTFHSYCYIEDGVFSISQDDMPDWWKGKGFHLATKEQRDLLFQKMKEVGYEWNAEKKELKKINSYCQENCKGFQETGKCFADEECKAKIEAEQEPTDEEMKELLHTEYEKGRADAIAEMQKPAWSEEDMSKVQRICKYLNEAKKYYADTTEVRECMDWLKSLKDRVQPKQE